LKGKGYKNNGKKNSLQETSERSPEKWAAEIRYVEISTSVDEIKK
jgi:hypothetical protein